MGKTSVVLKVVSILLREKLIKRALVVVPKRPMYLTWPAERDEWKDFNHLRMAILHDRYKEEALHSEADVYLINPDGLPWLLRQPKFSKLFGHDTLLCIDESSKFKHTNTQRFKLLRSVLDKFPRRLILTGTPNPNGYMDLFGQIYILDLGKTLGRYITHYRTQYFEPTGYGGYTWVLQDGAEQRIQKAIKPLVLRLDAEDYLKLPKAVPVPVEVELPPAARKTYQEMEDDMLTVLADGEAVMAQSAAAASMKCCQVASGGLYRMEDFEDKVPRRKWELIHNEKTDALMDLLEELGGEPLFLGFEFQHDLERIQAAYQKEYKAPLPYIGKGVGVARMKELEKLWNANRLPLLAAQSASAAHGINLQRGHCKHVGFYTLPWDYEVYQQFVERVRRQGNKSSVVFVHHFVAKDTVDKVKVAALNRKQKTQKSLLDSLREYVRQKNPQRSWD